MTQEDQIRSNLVQQLTLIHKSVTRLTTAVEMMLEHLVDEAEESANAD